MLQFTDLVSLESDLPTLFLTVKLQNKVTPPNGIAWPTKPWIDFQNLAIHSRLESAQRPSIQPAACRADRDERSGFLPDTEPAVSLLHDVSQLSVETTAQPGGGPGGKASSWLPRMIVGMQEEACEERLEGRVGKSWPKAF